MQTSTPSHHRYTKLISLTAASLCVLLSGCLHLQQELSLDTRGRGRFSLRISLPKAVYDAAIAPKKSPLGARWDRYFHTDSGMAAFGKDSGVTVDSYRVFEQDGRIYVQAAGVIDDMAKAAQAGSLGPWSWTRAKDGECTLNWKPHLQGKNSSEWGQALEGVRLKMVVKVSGTVIETDAGVRQGNTLAWSFDADGDGGTLVEPTSISVTYR